MFNCKFQDTCFHMIDIDHVSNTSFSYPLLQMRPGGSTKGGRLPLPTHAAFDQYSFQVAVATEGHVRSGYGKHKDLFSKAKSNREFYGP